MTFATLRLELRVGDCPSAREKRRRMRGIMDKLHKSFNVAVAEADRDGDPGQALLVIVTVARTRREARETLDRVADAVAVYPRAELISHVVTEV